MVLILGGFGTGKKSYAKALGYTEADMTEDAHADCPVLVNLEAIVRGDPEHAPDLLPLLRKKELVLCCEVGSGVVPLDPKERAWREAVGRLTCALAKEADSVVRVTAGIPVALKGELPCVCD